MGKIGEYYAVEAVKEIEKGYVAGGLGALKKEFPDAYDKMEKKLERNFNREGVDRYVKDVIFGLKKISYWRES